MGKCPLPHSVAKWPLTLLELGDFREEASAAHGIFNLRNVSRQQCNKSVEKAQFINLLPMLVPVIVRLP